MTTTDPPTMYPLPADREVEEIESLCMNCQEDGTTRLLLTRIPFFRDVVIMSFSCPHCHFHNNEIQNAGEIQQRGVRFTFKIDDRIDLQRQLVKSDNATIKFDDLDMEIPPGRGQLTNLEGVISMVMQDLEQGQGERKEKDPKAYSRIKEIVSRLAVVLEDDMGNGLPFTLTMDDPSGNSVIEPSPADKAGKYIRREYPRTAAQNAHLGLAHTEVEGDSSTNGAPPPSSMRPEYKARELFPAPPTSDGQTNVDRLDARDGQQGNEDDIQENQVYTFPSTCPGCTRPCACNMQMVKIPHFSEVVIMSIVCDHCGYRSNEVKTGGAVPSKGRKITLQVKTKEDLSRDILKAESCALSCPELSLNVEPGTLGGRFTTVEGLLTQVRNDLKANIFDADEVSGISQGDSMASDERVKWQNFFTQLDWAIDGTKQFTVILQDPLAASYVQSFKAPDPDEQITVEDYERTEEEEEDLGLRDLNVEEYQEDDGEDEAAETGKQGKLEEVVDAQEHGEAKPEIDFEEVQKEVRERLLGMNMSEGAEDGTQFGKNAAEKD